MLDAISMRESNSTLMRADLLDQVDASPKDGLATRELAPGDKPSLQDLAKAYGASRPTQQAFTQLVSEAVDSLPPAFGKAMTNVAIVVEEEHNDADRLGQYQGHPLAAPRYRTWLLHPDKITIYRKTICEHCHNRDEVEAMVYRVVIHEIAHHFGIDDPRLRELGW